MYLINYILDSDVDHQLDKSLRKLLSTCFTGANNEVFKTRRYYNDPPTHRWFLQERSDKLIAHVAAHEKIVILEREETKICAVAEVCVHPDHRGQGLVRILLKEAHKFMKANGFRFSALAGEAEIYESSGYKTINNLIYTNNGKIEPFPKGMVLELSAEKWPDSEVYSSWQSFLGFSKSILS